MSKTVYLQFGIAGIVELPVTAATQLASGGTEVVDGPDIIQAGFDTEMPSYWASSIFTTDPISEPQGAYYQINMALFSASFTAPPNFSNLPVNLTDANGNLLPISTSGVPQWEAVTVPDDFSLSALSLTKYWTGSAWVAADEATPTSPPGANDTAVVGGTPFASSGTLSLAGTTAATIGTLIVDRGNWTVTGTGGVGDTIGNLFVPMGATVAVDDTVAVKNIIISPNIPAVGLAVPADIQLNDGLPPGAVIDFLDENVHFTSTFDGNDTIVTASNASNITLATIALTGVVSISGAASDGNGGTDFTVTGTLPQLGPTTAVLDARSANDIGRGTGEFVVFGDSQVTPNGYQGTTVTASPTVNPAIAFVGSPVLPDDFRTKIPYDPSSTSWTLTVANGTSSEAVNVQLAPGVSPPPYATDVTYDSLTSTFTWEYLANSGVASVSFTIYDDSLLNSVGSAEAVYSASPALTFDPTTGMLTGSWTVPPAFAGGLMLQEGHKYTVDLQAFSTNNAAESESYFDLENSVGSAVYLPVVNNNAYDFHISNVVAGTTYFIDPAIATGYSYATGAGDPNFATLLLSPFYQTTPYHVTFTSGGKQQTVSVTGSVIYTFPTGGVSAFTVTGISADNLDPTNPEAFDTGVSFVSNGSFTGTQTPLTGPIDTGPTAGAVTASTNVGQTVDLTAAILAQVTPGVVGDTETITAVGTAGQGVLKLTNGDLTYAPSNSHIPANGSVADTFTYTVTDELGDTATGTVNMTISNPAVVINGTPKGSSTINGGSQTNIVNSVKTGNTIIEGGGNDIVNVAAGSANVYTGSGDVVVNLSGKNTTVIGGNGNDTVNVLAGSSNNNVTLGNGLDSIVEAAASKGSNTFILNGSNATMTLYGANDVAFIHGGSDTITDNSKGLEVKIASAGGASVGSTITLNNFLADKSGFVDLVGGIGGYKTAKAVVAALQSDGHSGTMLSLGLAGHIDFANTAQASLTASHFAIG